VIRQIDVSLSFSGSEGSAIAAGDLFNNMRLLIWTTKINSNSSPTAPLTDFISFLQTQDVDKIIYDEKFALPTQAFSPSGYNVPQVINRQFSRPVNLTLECFTDTVPAVSGWYARNGNILASLISDSSVSPNPLANVKFRLYYRVLRPRNR